MKPKHGHEKAQNKQLTRSFINSGWLVILAPFLTGGVTSFLIVNVVMVKYANEPFYPLGILFMLMISTPISSVVAILVYIVVYEIRTRFTNRKDPIDIPSLVISAFIIAIGNFLFLSLS